MDEYKKYEPIFGSWYLSKIIGKGSFGKVFEITREEYGATYKSALKIISVPQDDEEIKNRMTEGTDLDTISEYYEDVLKDIVNENEIMSKLKGNSNIVSYEDHQVIPHENGIGYDILIRMELLTPLVDRMIAKKLDENEVVKLGIDICKALELCHKKNIVHRDIKPQNIFVSESGDYKLGDFGIARTMEKTTGGMSKKGTYKYMAPEVFKGEDYDSSVDTYSLGIVLYSLLNGNRGPFLPGPPTKITHNDEEEARMRRFRGEPLPQPREAGMVLACIIKKACAYNPADRYRTAGQMRMDLENYYNNYGKAGERSANRQAPAMYAPIKQSGDDDVTYSEGVHRTSEREANIGLREKEMFASSSMAYGQGVTQVNDIPSNKHQKRNLVLLCVLIGILLLSLSAIVVGLVLLNNGEDGADETKTETMQEIETEEAVDVKQGSVEFNGHHYKVFDDSMRWDEAEKKCEELGGHLVIIESKTEQEKIEEILRSDSLRKQHYWLGGTKENGSWQWINGKSIPMQNNNSDGYSNWGEDKPNNNTDAAGYTGQESYLELQTLKNGSYMKWNDIDLDGIALGYEEGPNYCSTKYFGYICEWDE